jgi:hypothetical protein
MLSEKGKSNLSASIFNAFKDYKRKIEKKAVLYHSYRNRQSKEFFATLKQSINPAVTNIKTAETGNHRM